MIEQLTQDYLRAPLASKDKAMLDYALKLTQAPWQVIEKDVMKLREENFSDAAILDINQITGYFNFVNRLTDSLGVELEDYWREVDKKLYNPKPGD